MAVSNYNLVSYEGMRAVIKDNNTSEVIIDTMVSTHDRSTNTIYLPTVAGNALREHPKVLVELFGGGMVISANGTRRRFNLLEGVGLALYNIEETNNRKQQRFDLTCAGTVESLICKNQEIKLNKPLGVIVKNISKSGLLFSTAPATFPVGTVITLHINESSINTLLNCQIVRVQGENPISAEYGCKFLEGN